MSKDPGFVPIPFHRVGKVLLSIGLALIAAFAIGYVTPWFTLPFISFLLALALVVVGLYLIYFVPGEAGD